MLIDMDLTKDAFHRLISYNTSVKLVNLRKYVREIKRNQPNIIGG
jgi:hypothetical protein